MRTTSIACAALLVPFASLASISASPLVHAENGAADAPSGECVVYSELSHKDSRTLDVHLSNTCKTAMSCSVAWTVTCGKTTSVTRNAALLAGSAEQSWVASAASCEDDWSIDTSWSCKPRK